MLFLQDPLPVMDDTTGADTCEHSPDSVFSLSPLIPLSPLLKITKAFFVQSSMIDVQGLLLYK